MSEQPEVTLERVARRGFWERMWEHKVLQWGVGYLGAALALAHGAELVSHAFHWPEAIWRGVVITLVAGFPFALTLAWYHGHRGLRRISAGELAIASALLFIGAVFFTVSLNPDPEHAAETTPRTPPEPTVVGAKEARSVLPNSVAVLPFANLSPDSTKEYFSEGIHAEILDRLWKLNITVIARTSVMQYANTTRNITDIAREMNVETVMEGTVSYYADGRVVIRVGLSDGRTGARLWSESYDRVFEEIIAIQADIATNVAKALQAEFSTEQHASLEQTPTTSSEAYTLYLQARALIASNPDDGRIVTLLEQALSLDPNFAAAHGLVAQRLSQTLANSNAGQSTETARPQLAAKVEMHAMRALDLDSGDGNALGALGTMAFFQWRWVQAEERFRKAAEAPREPVSTVFLTYLLSYLGQHAEAIELAEQAFALDPLNTLNGGQIGFARGMAGEYEAAAQEFRRHVRETSASVPRLWLAFMEVALGNKDEAANHLEFVDRMIADNRLVVYLPELAYGFARAGMQSDAQRVFEEIEAASAAGQPVGPGTWAMAHLAVGDQESALRSLEEAAQRAARHEVDPGFFNVLNLKMNVTNDPVLREPRFSAVLDRIRGD